MIFFGQVLRTFVLFLSLLPVFAAPTLVWNSNTEEDLAGYRVYISDAGRIYPPIEVPDLRTLHSLTNFDAETTYWIYVTAFNTNNFESAPSQVLQYPDSPNCNYVLHPREGTVGPWPQIERFRVTSASRCTWMAEPLEDWIHIVSTSIGEGMSDVYYTVDQNRQPYPRQGLIRVADQLYSVYQTASGNSPTITSVFPQNVQLREGDQLELTVDATDISELRYEWFRNGAHVPGATNNYLYIPNINADEAGAYTVTISSAVVTLTNGPTTVSVYAKPRIREDGQPKSVAVAPGEGTTLRVGATGPDLLYQWFKDGKLLLTRGPTLSLPTVTTNDLGVYHARVSNLIGSIDSQPAIVFRATPEQAAGIIDIRSVAATNVILNASGIPGAIYQVQTSIDLISWLTIATTEADSGGKFNITLPETVQADRWFIRTVRQRSL